MADHAAHNMSVRAQRFEARINWRSHTLIAAMVPFVWRVCGWVGGDTHQKSKDEKEEEKGLIESSRVCLEVHCMYRLRYASTYGTYAGKRRERRGGGRNVRLD